MGGRVGVKRAAEARVGGWEGYEQPPKIYIPCYLSATDEGIIEPIPFSIFIYKRRSQDVPGIQNIKDKRMGAHAMR